MMIKWEGCERNLSCSLLKYYPGMSGILLYIWKEAVVTYLTVLPQRSCGSLVDICKEAVVVCIAAVALLFTWYLERKCLDLSYSTVS
jgi:hypothetical protein